MFIQLRRRDLNSIVRIRVEAIDFYMDLAHGIGANVFIGDKEIPVYPTSCEIDRIIAEQSDVRSMH
jgi:hypothetical protein